MIVSWVRVFTRVREVSDEPGFVECDMTVGANTAHKEVDAAVLLDFSFEAGTLGLEVGSVAVEDIHVLDRDVDVAEEIVPHKAVIALGVVDREAHILVHVESNDIAERHFTFLIKLYQTAIHA